MTNWRDVDFDDLRTRGDPELDDAVAAFAMAHADLELRDLASELARQSVLPPADRHAAMRDVLIGVPEPPWDVDPATPVIAADFFAAWGLHIGAALFCAALPAAYAAADGAEVLVRGSDLVGGTVTRRVAETGQMLIDVMALGDEPARFEAGATAMSTVRGVRLFHSAVRASLLSEDAEPWPSDELGVPVNQEDLLGTLLTFTVITYRALERMGVRLDGTRVAAHRRTWDVIGFHLGIEPQLLPLSEADGDELVRIIAERTYRPSDAGRRLAAALLADIETTMPLGFLKLPRAVMWYLLDEGVPQLLAIPPAPWWSQPFLRYASSVNRKVPTTGLAGVIVRWLSARVSRQLIRWYVDRELEGAPPFRVPPELVRRWRVQPAGPIRRVRQRSRRRIRAGIGRAG